MQTRAVHHGLVFACRHEPFGSCVGAPGSVAFHRLLQKLNAEHRAAPPLRAPDVYEPTRPLGVTPTGSSPDLPTLAEVLPVAATPQPRPVTVVAFVQRAPATGRLIDLLA